MNNKNITTLQKLRLEQGLSQSQLAMISGVNFRTLQDFDQGRKSLTNAKGEMIYRLSQALKCSMDDLLTGDVLMEANSISHDDKQFERLSQYAKKLQPKNQPYYSEYYSFPVLVKRTGVKMEHIYPTKQKLVASIHDALTPRTEVCSVMLFGSSVSMRCTYDSDTDLAIRLNDSFNTREVRNDISELVQEICEWNADILWFDSLSPSERVYHDICRGVQIV